MRRLGETMFGRPYLAVPVPIIMNAERLRFGFSVSTRYAFNWA